MQCAGVGFVLFSLWPQQFTFLVISAVVMGIGLGSYLAGIHHHLYTFCFLYLRSCELTLRFRSFVHSAQCSGRCAGHRMPSVGGVARD